MFVIRWLIVLFELDLFSRSVSSAIQPKLWNPVFPSCQLTAAFFTSRGPLIHRHLAWPDQCKHVFGCCCFTSLAGFLTCFLVFISSTSLATVPPRWDLRFSAACSRYDVDSSRFSVWSCLHLNFNRLLTFGLCQHDLQLRRKLMREAACHFWNKQSAWSKNLERY